MTPRQMEPYLKRRRNSCAEAQWPTLLRGRENIHAVLKGSAVNNDGSEKVAYDHPQRQWSGRRGGGRR